MGFARTILGIAAATCLAAAPALADPQRGHAAAPQTHATGPKSTPSTPTSGTTTTTPTSDTSKTSPTTLNPIAAKISAKPQLNANVTAMLPKNMTLNQASAGFQNQGQFLAALHVNQNLNCSCFKQIQTDMTQKGMSLGQTIQDVRKSANATTEATKAETQADSDVKSTSTTSTSSTTSTKLNPIAAKISSKPQLLANVTALLPKGMSLNDASAGFKNQGQFIAALHVNQNLSCACFTQLQADMTKKGMSLGQAIQDVSHTSTSTATTQASTAETEANNDLAGKTTKKRPHAGGHE